MRITGQRSYSALVRMAMRLHHETRGGAHTGRTEQASGGNGEGGPTRYASRRATGRIRTWRALCRCSRRPTRHCSGRQGAAPLNSCVVEDASRPRQRAADGHPLAVRREAPHNKRMQQTSPPANRFASGFAPDPQRVRLPSLCRCGACISPGLWYYGCKSRRRYAEKR